MLLLASFVEIPTGASGLECRINLLGWNGSYGGLEYVLDSFRGKNASLHLVVYLEGEGREVVTREQSDIIDRWDECFPEADGGHRRLSAPPDIPPRSGELR